MASLIAMIQSIVVWLIRLRLLKGTHTFILGCSFLIPRLIKIMVALLLLFCTVGVSTPIPVLTIQSPDGDLIDCIRTIDQIAFQHPLLKNHILQEFPTGMPNIENEIHPIWQVWQESGQKCPSGTISVRRHLINNTTVSHTKVSSVGSQATEGHKYAIVYKKSQQSIYGTRATLNVWDPVVKAYGDFSLAQIWVASGTYDTADINTMEAGWQVYPARYLDNQPRFFTYWTKDAYRSGCYGIHCPGFVQTSSTIALEAAISRSSTLGGDQYEITIQIWKDQFSGNWWLGVGRDMVPVGYWPAAIFTVLSDHATRVDWGGEVLYRNISGMITEAPMGSGQFADKGYRKAAYFCDLRIAIDNQTLMPVQDFMVITSDPKYYTVKKQRNMECGKHFYFGGPGPLRSMAVRQLASVSLVFSVFSYFSTMILSL